VYSDYGVRETTVKIGRKYVTVQEKIPDIIVPDLEDFNVSIASLKVISQYNEKSYFNYS
jgi:hypothetical protein